MCSCNVYALNPRRILVFFSPARGAQVVKMASAQEKVIMCSTVCEGKFSETCVAFNFCGSYRTDPTQRKLIYTWCNQFENKRLYMQWGKFQVNYLSVTKHCNAVFVALAADSSLGCCIVSTGQHLTEY